MGWREGLMEGLFGDILQKRVEEAAVGAESDRLWRPVAGVTGWSGLGRDLSFRELQGCLAEADDAYRNNPLAFRIVELGVDFVLGRGMKLRASDPAAERFLSEWWGHPLNNWPLRQFELARELSIAGEVFLTLHTNSLDGMTYVRQAPSGLIDLIETNPEDVEDERRFHQLGGGAVGGDVGCWWSREVETNDSGIVEPSMRHYAVNRLVGMVRGQGDLAALLPWLRRYKDWLTDRVRLNKYRQAFLFDVTLEGADRRGIVARQSELAVPPEPGSIIVHNEKESWSAVRPEIGADDSAADGLALRLMIAAGSGFPLHFLGEAAEANLATATAMASPTLRRLERRQLYYGWLVSDLGRECLRRSGRFGDGLNVKVWAEFEDLNVEDNERIARSAGLAAGALKTAREMGWLGDLEARELFGRFVGEPGINGAIGEEISRVARRGRSGG